MTPSAIDIVHSLRLSTGQRWGEVAEPFQREDVRAILGDGPPFHFLTRPRGASKTMDMAAVAVGQLLTAGSRLRFFWLAADRDQGKLCVQAIQAFVDTTPGLAAALSLTGSSVEARASGARLDVLTSDVASSWGLLPSGAVFVDELCQWPDAAAPQQLWDSVSSAVAKVSDAKLIVLSSAGDPAHWSRRVFEHALTSPLWRVHEVPGPTPWMDPERIEEQRQRLLPSTFARLFMNEWVAGEDRLASIEALRACVTLDGPQEPDTAQHRYVCALDVGLKRDRTVASIAHLLEGRVVVLDRLAVWAGSHESPVLLAEVEDWIVKAASAYGCKIVCDPWQSVGLMQRLAAHGLAVEEFTFSAQSVGRLAHTLFTCVHDHALALPDDPELLDELAHVRLRETSPGVFRLDHDSGRHDDRAISLAMCAYTLLSGAQAPVHLDDEIAAIRESLRREARLKGRGERSTEEQYAAEGGQGTEEMWGREGRPGTWRERLDRG